VLLQSFVAAGRVCTFGRGVLGRNRALGWALFCPTVLRGAQLYRRAGCGLIGSGGNSVSCWLSAGPGDSGCQPVEMVVDMVAVGVGGEGALAGLCVYSLLLKYISGFRPPGE